MIRWIIWIIGIVWVWWVIRIIGEVWIRWVIRIIWIVGIWGVIWIVGEVGVLRMIGIVGKSYPIISLVLVPWLVFLSIPLSSPIPNARVSYNLMKEGAWQPGQTNES